MSFGAVGQNIIGRILVQQKLLPLRLGITDYLLMIYPKNEQQDLTADERKSLKAAIEHWR